MTKIKDRSLGICSILYKKLQVTSSGKINVTNVIVATNIIITFIVALHMQDTYVRDRRDERKALRIWRKKVVTTRLCRVTITIRSCYFSFLIEAL